MSKRILVASLKELPEHTGTVVAVDNQEIALFRMGGEVYAMENLCPHKEGPLAEGEVEDGIVTCPWHAWQICVRTGEVVYDPSIRARTYQCCVEGEDVYLIWDAT
ncbi:MAG: Rieske (2Fe-2S) protein [Chthonomonadales bacterium]